MSASAAQQNRDSRKVKRVRLERPMRVVIASIGAQIRYETTARDISHTGFFLFGQRRFSVFYSRVVFVLDRLFAVRRKFYAVDDIFFVGDFRAKRGAACGVGATFDSAVFEHSFGEFAVAFGGRQTAFVSDERFGHVANLGD